MKRYAIFSVWLLAIFLLPLLAGCSSVSIDTQQYLGLPTYPPTDPATVAILHEPPMRPHVRLGEVVAEPSGSPPVTEIENKLRQAAAKMGANAIVIVADRTERMGVVVTGPWWGRQINRVYGRVIVGVAIRYQQ
jgi:hypothetical protein